MSIVIPRRRRGARRRLGLSKPPKLPKWVIVVTVIVMTLTVWLD